MVEPPSAPVPRIDNDGVLCRSARDGGANATDLDGRREFEKSPARSFAVCIRSKSPVFLLRYRSLVLQGNVGVVVGSSPACNARFEENYIALIPRWVWG